MNKNPNTNIFDYHQYFNKFTRSTFNFPKMSASPRVFITGTSGYLGGNIVGRLVEKHPEWHVVALLRNEAQEKVVLARWPKIEVVIGDLDDSALMIKEGAKADVVLRKFFIMMVRNACADICCRSWICRSYSRCPGPHPGIE